MNLTNADRATTRGILAYVGIAYALSIALSLVVGLTGGYQSRFVFGFGVASMFVPTVAMLVVKFAMNEKVQSFGWNRFPLRYLPIALLLMPIVMHAVMLPVAAALWGTLPWEEWLTPQGDGLYHTPVSRGWGVLTAAGLGRRIAMNIVVGLIANSTLAFFEEVGWRAWMLPRLVVLMGTRRAIVVSSMIWAFWHTPFTFSGIHHLDGIPVVLTALTMPIVISGAGLVIGWLWVRTESIWMVALAHGALNNWGQFAFKFMGGLGTGQASDVLVLGAGGLALLAAGSFLLVYGCPSASPLAARSRPSSASATP
jgi:membrane protease YdiL (CAAX protease family)